MYKKTNKLFYLGFYDAQIVLFTCFFLFLSPVWAYSIAEIEEYGITLDHSSKIAFLSDDLCISSQVDPFIRTKTKKLKPLRIILRLPMYYIPVESCEYKVANYHARILNRTVDKFSDSDVKLICNKNAEIEAEVQRLEVRLEKETEALKQQLKEQEKTASKLEEEKNELTLRLKAQEQSVGRLKEDEGGLKQELKEQGLKEQKQSTDRLKEERDELKQELKEQEQSTGRLKEERDGLKQELKEQEQSTDRLKEERDGLKQELKKKEQSTGRLKKERDGLKQELQEQQKLVGKLEEKLYQERRSIKAIKKEAYERRQKLNDTQCQKEMLASEVFTLSAALDEKDRRLEHNEAEIIALNLKLDELQASKSGAVNCFSEETSANNIFIDSQSVSSCGSLGQTKSISPLEEEPVSMEPNNESNAIDISINTDANHLASSGKKKHKKRKVKKNKDPEEDVDELVAVRKQERVVIPVDIEKLKKDLLKEKLFFRPDKWKKNKGKGEREFHSERKIGGLINDLDKLAEFEKSSSGESNQHVELAESLLDILDDQFLKYRGSNDRCNMLNIVFDNMLKIISRHDLYSKVFFASR